MMFVLLLFSWLHCLPALVGCIKTASAHQQNPHVHILGISPSLGLLKAAAAAAVAASQMHMHAYIMRWDAAVYGIV